MGLTRREFLASFSVLTMSTPGHVRIANKLFDPLAEVVPPPPPLPTGGNEYFDALTALPYWWKGYSLRPLPGHPLTTDPYYSNQCLGTAQGGYVQGAPDGNTKYDPTNDTDQHRQDATKLVIPVVATSPFGSTTLNSAVTATDTVWPIFNFQGSALLIGRLLRVDAEYVMITAYDNVSVPATITVTRGYLGSTPAPHAAGVPFYGSTNTLYNQIRLPLGATNGHTYLFTWEAYWTDSYIKTGLATHKGFQFATPPTTDVNGGPWTEIKPSYNGGAASPGFNALTDVGGVDTRLYPAAGGTLPWTSDTLCGPNVTDNDPAAPHVGYFIIKPNTWTRFWAKFILQANDYDPFSLWVADPNQGPTQIFDGLMQNLSTSGTQSIKAFWHEWNTSTDRYVRNQPGTDGTRNLVSYVRNVGALIDPPSDLSTIIVRPA